MKIYLFISFLALIPIYTNAQDIVLRGQIQNLPDGYVILLAFEKTEYVKVDSSYSENGSFYFVFPESFHPGLYALDFLFREGHAGPRWDPIRLEFIYNQESMEIFAANVNDILGTGGISGSRENDLYYDFLERQYYFTRDSVSRAYAEYLAAVEKGDGQPGAREDFMAMQERWDNYLLATAENNNNLYTSHIIRASRFPIIDPEGGGWKSHRYHFFDSSPIDDPLLLFHPVYISRISDFLSLFYIGPGNDTILPVTEYYDAIDIIMTNTSNDSELRGFVTGYLLQIFEFYDNEAAQIYIADNYLDEQCESDIVELVLSRMEGYKMMQPGNHAPGLVVKDRNDQTIRLDQIKNKYVLVMFWASTCEHCQKLIPKLHEWYMADNEADIEVLSISIDTTLYQWEAFIDEHKLQWICAYEPLGWNGKVARDYYVYATPSLFLLDEKRNIIAKPFTYRDFLKELKRL